jgi:hypothetical protein
VIFERLDPVALQGLRAGFMALFAFVSAGAGVLAIGLITSWSTASTLFDQAGPTVGVGLGVWLLCLGYLPNAIIAALSYVTGAGFSMGVVTVTPMVFTPGSVPGVPLLAALPEREFAMSPIVLVLAAAIGAFVGWCCRKVADRPAARMRAVLVAAVTVAVGCLVLAATAGGRLASGAFDPVTVPAGLLALLAAGWILVPGMLVAWLTGPRPKPVVVVEDIVEEPYEEEPEDVDAVAEEDDDYDDEEFDEIEDDLAEEMDEELDEEDFDEELDDEPYEDELSELDELEAEELSEAEAELAETDEADLDEEPRK